MTRRMARPGLAGALVACVWACGGGGGDVVEPPPAVASVTVSLAASQIFIGQTSQGTAVLRDAQSNVLTGRTVSWSSSNTAVATVGASTGLVTGVAAGSATITATSESKTGQADITVTIDPATQPQIQNVTVTQDGQPANLNQVAGTLTLSFRVQVPSGYNGTLTVKVDTVEFLRETVSAPALRVLPGTTASATTVTIDRTVAMQTNATTTTVGANQIQDLPKFRNGDLSAIAQLTPSVAGGFGAQQTVNFRTDNPMMARGFYRFGAQSAVSLIDGKTYTGGTGEAAVVFTTFGAEQIQEFEVTVTDYAAEYGRSTGGVINAIQKVTRTNQQFFSLPALALERANLTMVLSRVKINNTDFFPQQGYFGNSAYTTDLIGSGFANTAQQAQGLTPPMGKKFVLAPQLSTSLFAGTPVYGRAGIDQFNIDGVGPHQVSAANEPVVSFLDRLNTVGGPAFSNGFGYGGWQNQLSGRYDFADGFRADRLADVTGINTSQTWWYAGPIADKANLYTPQYRITGTFNLPESSGSRLYTAGARVFDGRGNSSDWTIRTSPGNPWNISGQLSLAGQLGVDEGAFGFTSLRGTLGTSGMPDETVWNSTALDPTIGWGWTASSVLAGLPDGWLSARGKLSGNWYFGTGAAKDGFQVMPSTGGVSSGTASVTAKSLTDAFSTQVPVAQGLYEFEFKGAGSAGLYVGDMLWPRSRRLLVDYTAPINAAITYNGAVTPGALSSATLTGFDALGISRVRVGVRYNYPAAVTGNEIYTPLGEFTVPGSLSGMRTTSLSLPISSVVPVGFWFANMSSGVINWGNFYRSNGGMMQLMDYGWNFGPPTFASFSNTAPVPTLSNVSDVHASVGTNNWCPGTCSSGGSKTVSLTFNYFDDRPSGALTISKAAWFGIPSNGQVYRLGEQFTPTIATEGLGRRIRYDLSLDLSDYCGPSGNMLVFPIGWAADRKSSLKGDAFTPVTVRTPTRFTNNCNVPPPPLPPPPP